MKNIVEPTVVRNEDRDETRTTHPAFAQISASRVTGHATLYGSDFTHHATIRIRIYESELVRNLSHDRHHGKNEYIEVELSEAQWATFISALNVGNGPPCTLRYLRGERIPDLPHPQDRSKQFAGEIDSHCQDCIENLAELANKVEEMKLPKGKTKEIKDAISHAIMQLRSNLPFIAKSFGEHVEDTIEKAKQEIHGYTMGVITRTGLAALGAVSPLEIESKSSE